ncbi:SAP protein, partial [Pandion haliaetus]|nr:SAP protein [Pandion haliaetus]
LSLPPAAGASPLHKCGERPEDWCRDVVTAAKCGALQLCRITVWDQALGLCQPRESPTGALKFQEPPPAPRGPAQDFADLVAPFIANVPLLLHPQDLP